MGNLCVHAYLQGSIKGVCHTHDTVHESKSGGRPATKIMELSVHRAGRLFLPSTAAYAFGH
jgi:hypothetical protein